MSDADHRDHHESSSGHKSRKHKDRDHKEHKEHKEKHRDRDRDRDRERGRDREPQADSQQQQQQHHHQQHQQQQQQQFQQPFHQPQQRAGGDDVPRRRRERKSASGWDVAPTPGMPGMFGLGQIGGISSNGNDNRQTNQIERQRKRLFVGNLPPQCNEFELGAFLNATLMAKCQGAIGPIVECSVNIEKQFAFIEMRDRHEANVAIVVLDNSPFHGYTLKLQRPKDYVAPPEDAVGNALGFAPPIALAGPHSAEPYFAELVPDSPNKLFVGGVPLSFDEAALRELLQSIGPVKHLGLARDPLSRVSRGYGFVEYVDAADADKAIAALNRMPIEENVLTVNRAVADPLVAGMGLLQPMFRPGDTITKASAPGAFLTPVPLPLLLAGVRGTAGHIANSAKKSDADKQAEAEAKKANADGADDDDDEPAELPLFDPLTSEHATRVVMLINGVAPEELVKDEEYYDLLADVREEAEFFGKVREIRVPRRVEPELNEEPQPAPPGTGRIFIEYAELESARQACHSMGGRVFDGRILIATFYDEQLFNNNQLGPVPVSAKMAAEQQARQ